MKKKAARDKRGKTGASRGGKRTGRVPPPDNDLWPVWCRGRLWTREAAQWFAGRCQLCAYACPPPEEQRRLNKWAGLPTSLICTNHPQSPGRMHQVTPTETCRNFKAAQWRSPRSKSPKRMPGPTTCKSNGKVCYIPVSHGLFATVDAADYKWLSKHRWSAVNMYGHFYAVRRGPKGRTLYMHREIMHVRPELRQRRTARLSLRVCRRL